MPDSLAKAKARIQHQPLPGNPTRLTGGNPPGQEIPHLRHYIAVIGRLLHGTGLPAHMHKANRQAGGGRSGHRAGATQRPHIVQ